MKIIYIIGGMYAANGMSDVMTRKVNWLARHTDAELHVVLTERPDLPHFYPLEPNVKVVNFGLNFDRLDTLPIWRKILLYKGLMKKYRRCLTSYLMQERADIVVSALRRDINFLCDIPDGSHKVGELHFARSSYRIINKSYLPASVNQWLTARWQAGLMTQLRRLSAFIVLSHEDAEAWKELSNLHVIPNSIKALPQRSEPSIRRKRVIAAGRYTAQKGFDMLIHAWSMIEASHEDWELVIFGSGDKSHYQALVNQYGVHHVDLCGQTKDLYGEMNKASIFAFSSRYEGFGLVLAEAMACGLAVVSFACPCGPRDIVTHEEDGLLVPPEEVEVFATALACLMDDEPLRQRLSSNAIVSSQRFTEDVVMQSWLQLFASLK